jgi:hypothetical protein
MDMPQLSRCNTIDPTNTYRIAPKEIDINIIADYLRVNIDCYNLDFFGLISKANSLR